MTCHAADPAAGSTFSHTTLCTGYAVAWLAGDCIRRQLAGQDLGSLWPQASNGVVWAALLWSAVGPGAAAAWLQTKVSTCLRVPMSCSSQCVGLLWLARVCRCLLVQHGLEHTVTVTAAPKLQLPQEKACATPASVVGGTLQHGLPPTSPWDDHLLHGFLQGQAVVPASEAQIIYSLTPIPAAAFAALLPGGAEAMGLLGYLVNTTHAAAINNLCIPGHAAACGRSHAWRADAQLLPSHHQPENAQGIQDVQCPASMQQL